MPTPALGVTIFGVYLAPAEVVVIGVMGLSIFTAGLIWRRDRQHQGVQRWVVACIPIIAAYLLLAWLISIGNAPYNWASVQRLTAPYAMAHGYDPYPAGDEGPLVMSMYPPLFPLIYLPVTLLASPTHALIAGAAMAMAIYMLPAAWLILHVARRTEGGMPVGAYALLGFVAVSFATVSLRLCAVMPLPDAPALAFGLLACAALYQSDQPNARRRLWISAMFVAMATWTKQTMAPLIIALPLYLWLADGLRCALRHVLCLAICGLTLSAVMIAAFGPFDELYTQLVDYPGRYPFKTVWRDDTALFTQLVLESLAAPVLIFAVVALAAWRQWKQGEAGLRQTLREQRWLMFPVVALFMTPLAFMAMIKAGGAQNVFAPIAYYILVAACLGAVELAGRDSRRQTHLATVAVVVGFLLLSPNFRPTYRELIALRSLHHNRLHRMAEFSKEHPRQVYYPHWPIVTLQTDGELYHLGSVIVPRADAGVPLTEQHLAAGLPDQMRYIIFPAGDPPYYIESLMKFFPEFNRRMELDVFPPGWIVYVRNDEGFANEEAR